MNEQEDWCFVGGGGESEGDDREWEFVGGERHKEEDKVKEGGEQKREVHKEEEEGSDDYSSSEGGNSDIHFFFMREQIESKAVKNFGKNKNKFSSDNVQKKFKEAMEIKVLVKNLVLPFLPAKSLTRFRLVSKEWDNWIGNPFLAHQQSYYFQRISGFFCQKQMMTPTFLTLDRHAYGVPEPSLNFMPELVTIISSCNGLLLCKGSLENDHYYICNPANNRWSQILDPEYYHGHSTTTILDFEPSVLNMDATYYLISAVPQFTGSIIFFEVYSSKGKCWRLSETMCTELEDDFITGDDKFLLDGIAYWVTSKRKILAFDRKNWIHGVISLPSDCPSGGILANVNRELCYIGMSIDPIQNQCSIEIYGGAVDLNLKHKVALGFDLALYEFRILHCVDGNILMFLNGGLLWSYDLASESLEVMCEVEGEPEETSYLPYVNSMVAVL